MKLRREPQSVWLDTDIGDDTDDILALALICASPELVLAGVSTVFGETKARARLAQTLLQLCGCTGVPVAAGCGLPLPGLQPPAITLTGPAKRGPIAQLPCARPASRLPKPSPLHGVDALAAHLRGARGQTAVVTIGALTNLATLLLREPALSRKLPRVVSMAGEFKRPTWEWNVGCDPLAAATVFASGVPVDVIPWDIGMACTISPAQLGRLLAARSPTGRFLARAVQLWRKAKGRRHRPHLFDPMAVAVLLHPEWFGWRRGRVSVSLAPATFARTQFVADPQGPHRVAWRVRAPLAVRTVWNRILAL
ncbi:MAG: nucleoside hydrolase [Opitutales bacterium]